MHAFLVALAAVFAQIAHALNETAIGVEGMGNLGDFLAIGFYGLSATFSNAAQLCLDGAGTAFDLQEQVDSIQDGLADALLESALGQAITALWPTFPMFLADPVEWLLVVLSSAFPFVADFLTDPETWLQNALEDLLPIAITPGGFETILVGGVTYYANEQAASGQGFSFTVPEGDWALVQGIFYAITAYAGMAPLTAYRGLTPHMAVNIPTDTVAGTVIFTGITAPPFGLVEGDTWRVLSDSPGSLAFRNQMVLQHATNPMQSRFIDVQTVGGTGPATWALDWGGFFTWLEDAFLSVSGILYALLERIARYFWEGVY